MMTKYHPDSRFLSDFASGSLPQAQAVCVSSHLSFCSKCRGHIQQLNSIGGIFLEKLEPQDVDAGLFSKILSRVEEKMALQGDQTTELNIVETSQPNRLPSSQSYIAEGELPNVVRKLANGSVTRLNWIKFGSTLKLSPLNTGDRYRDTALYQIRAGGKIPKHKHNGEEITVVLKGSFSDSDDIYQQGDFIVRGNGEIHQPTATLQEDCLCLATLDNPIIPTNWLYRILNTWAIKRIAKAVDFG